ncbi:hypothetical protein CEUSTIGMA_g12789.t1 [Chlamydomonas eustigma]|uniref:SF3 helicase domain-containing protein n=1 Tax=Chlamydomonas eustigma TaxID=1157962 RepID=A0A250XQL7_9CHLO|nr:hypothetical protein CEUSTIGMA_g12789.t1 [Chlamydomonas eustigma]|eukprot:GAX85371.1 hypothetical protein CEUSTIGMA_g12789.t1 [Chlamydomonas eustigma]
MPTITGSGTFGTFKRDRQVSGGTVRFSGGTVTFWRDRHLLAGPSPGLWDRHLGKPRCKAHFPLGSIQTPMKFIKAMTGNRLSDVWESDSCSFASPHACEYLKSPCNVRPYFDSEAYHDDEPDASRIRAWRDEFSAAVRDVFSSQPSCIEPVVHIATRHGWVLKAGKRVFKVSHRAFVPNYVIEYTLLSDVITFARKSDLFDVLVYKAREQLLNMVGCSKSTSDLRVLTPEDPEVDPGRFVVQNLDGSEERFVLMPSVQEVDVEEDMQSLLLSQEGTASSRAQHPAIALGSTQNVEAVVRYLNLLSKDRWTRYDTWSKIAMALKNDFGDRFKDEFTALSRAAPNFDLHAVEKLWNSIGCGSAFTGRPISFATIRMWARLDDPEGHAAVKASSVPPYILERFNKSDRGRAEIVASLIRREVKKCGKSDFYVFESGPNVWRKTVRDNIQIRVSYALEEAMNDVQVYYKHRAFNPVLNDEQRKVFLDMSVVANKHSLSSMTYGTIVKTTALAATMLDEPNFVDLLDSIPHLLGVKNGVVDLRDGKLRPREPEDLIYSVVDCEYDPLASVELFDRTILQIMAGSEQMARYLQTLLGYGITGEVSEEIFVVFNGAGRNGKGVITQCLSMILGNMFVDMNVGLICSAQNKIANEDAELHKLLGARIALFKESGDGNMLRKERVQLMSGGDGIPCRRLYCDATTLKPHHLCILETNTMPTIDQVIPSIMQRLICIPFPVTFRSLSPGEEWSATVQPRDNDLKSKLRDQKKAILKWLVQGAVRWYATKDLRTNAPLAVREFTTSYLAEQDLVNVFIDEECVVDGGAKVSAVEFIKRFQDWYVDSQGKQDCPKNFGVKGLRSRQALVRG